MAIAAHSMRADLGRLLPLELLVNSVQLPRHDRAQREYIADKVPRAHRQSQRSFTCVGGRIASMSQPAQAIGVCLSGGGQMFHGHTAMGSVAEPESERRRSAPAALRNGSCEAVILKGGICRRIIQLSDDNQRLKHQLAEAQRQAVLERQHVHAAWKRVR
jgi:hypothetical protein